MGILITVFTILLIILAVLLILIILLQSDKGSGMGILGGGGSQSAFGSSTADVLTKITGTMVALFMIISFGLAVVESHRPRSVIDSLPEENSKTSPELKSEEKNKEIPKGTKLNLKPANKKK